MKKLIKNIIRKTLYLYYDLFYSEKDTVKMMYYPFNFGDAINPIIVKELSNKKILKINPNFYKKDHLLVIGSILQMANKNSIIWGTGLISKDVKVNEEPKKILAVRGPKTRARLLEMGFDCPEVYGDPGLLLPLIYNPKIEKKYKLGIIPHYVDKENPWIKNIDDPDILVLDIITKNPYEFINQLLSCEKIISTSLHGIITADAYNISSLWIKLSDKIIGGDFKFIDYFESVKRKEIVPINVNINTTIDDIIKQFYSYKIDIDLELLLSVAPFKIIEKRISKND